MASSVGFFQTDYTFRLGARSFTVAPPAKLMLFAYVAMFAAFVAAMLLGAFRGPTPRVALAALVFGLIAYPLLIAYMVYLNNCLIVGKCSALAWILSGFSVATAVLYVLSLVALGPMRAVRAARPPAPAPKRA